MLSEWRFRVPRAARSQLTSISVSLQAAARQRQLAGNSQQHQDPADIFAACYRSRAVSTRHMPQVQLPVACNMGLLHRRGCQATLSDTRWELHLGGTVVKLSETALLGMQHGPWHDKPSTSYSRCTSYLVLVILRVWSPDMPPGGESLYKTLHPSRTRLSCNLSLYLTTLTPSTCSLLLQLNRQSLVSRVHSSFNYIYEYTHNVPHSSPSPPLCGACRAWSCWPICDVPKPVACSQPYHSQGPHRESLVIEHRRTIPYMHHPT